MSDSAFDEQDLWNDYDRLIAYWTDVIGASPVDAAHYVWEDFVAPMQNRGYMQDANRMTLLDRAYADAERAGLLTHRFEHAEGAGHEH